LIFSVINQYRYTSTRNIGPTSNLKYSDTKTMRFEITPHTMEFIKSAKTSRGEYHQKISHLIRLGDGVFEGVGEAAPLADLSIDGNVDFYNKTASLLDSRISNHSWNIGNRELPSLCQPCDLHFIALGNICNFYNLNPILHTTPQSPPIGYKTILLLVFRVFP
jgi:hypothetical protein